jgi:excisionase family DNA binding protein
MNHVYLTSKEASEMLRISTSKLYKMTMQKSIPHYRCGGKVLFKTNELIDFVEKGISTMSSESIDRFDLISPFPMSA